MNFFIIMALISFIYLFFHCKRKAKYGLFLAQIDKLYNYMYINNLVIMTEVKLSEDFNDIIFLLYA